MSTPVPARFVAKNRLTLIDLALLVAMASFAVGHVFGHARAVQQYNECLASSNPEAALFVCPAWISATR